MNNDDINATALLKLTTHISPYDDYTVHTRCARRERHYLPRRSEEAIGASNGEMAQIHQIVRKSMPSL
jgi:hypothetical protein